MKAEIESAGFNEEGGLALPSFQDRFIRRYSLMRNDDPFSLNGRAHIFFALLIILAPFLPSDP
jgi:hypothetical protein